MKMKKETKHKYLAFIQDCYKHGSFDKNLLRDSHEVSNDLLRAMQHTRCITTSAGVGQWIGNAPTQDVINSIFKEYHKMRGAEYAKRKTKPHGKQLKITPIRKAPVSTPEPIVKEAEYDNSNSKVFLILAVGAIVGFMIATIIWK